MLNTKFTNADGIVVPALSIENAVPEHVMAALTFLQPGCKFEIEALVPDVSAKDK